MPSPPKYNICREWAGIFGIAGKTLRMDHGHSGEVLMPIPLLYSLSALLKLNCNVKFVDCQAENYNLKAVINTIKKDNISSNELNDNYYRPTDTGRDDPDLITVVEELGPEADGSHADLKIVEIPDDVKWVIDEYDGWESVEEEHRSWS